VDRQLQLGKCDLTTIAADVQLYTAKKADIPVLCDFVQRWSGGNKSLFMDPFMSFVKSFVPAGKELSIDFWKMLTNLKVADGELCTHFVYGMLKHQASADEVKDKKLPLSRGDFTMLEKPAKDGGKKEDMLAGDEMMRQLRSFTAAHGGALDHSKLISTVDILIVRLVCGRPSTPKLQCLDDAGSYLVQRLRDACKNPMIPDTFTKCQSGYVPAPASTSAPSAEPPSPAEVVRMGPDGKPINSQKVALVQKQFMAGKYVESGGIVLFMHFG